MVFCLVLLLVPCCVMTAQTTFGAIGGMVTDPTGAPIPKAQLTLTNVATSAAQTAATNEAGMYQFVNVAPGSYRLEVEATGFQRFTRGPITVQVQQTYRIDVEMTLGASTQTVQVSAETPMIQSETSSLGQVISGNVVSEMPLNGRNVLNLVTLVPSVVPQGGALGTPVGQNSTAWGNYQIGGALAGQSVIYLDGAPLNNSFISQVTLLPTQDSIQEFKVQTNNLGPEWGRFGGGVMNFITKSGANKISGGAYEYLRNKVLNANTFFNNRAGIPVGAFTQNQYGAYAGGPVHMPGVYDGRNKTFWFASWEGFRLRQGTTAVTTVPTEAERRGDFSSLRDAGGNLIPIYDPLTVCGHFGNPACAVGANGQPVYTRQQFPGNIIPTSRLNPAATALTRLWPGANTAGARFTNVNNYIANYSSGGDSDQIVIRGDHNVSDKQRLFARFTYGDLSDIPTDPLGTGVCVDRCSDTFTTKNIVVDDTYVFTPTLVSGIRLSYNRWAYDRFPILGNFDLTSIGWPSFMNEQIPAFQRTPPTPNVQGMANEIFGTNGMGSSNWVRDDTWDLSGDLTAMRGRHTLKVGGQVRVERIAHSQTNNASGAFTFDRGFTASSPFSGVGGFGFASYLLGYPISGNLVLNNFTMPQEIYRAVYFGDTWNVTSRLTLNLGLRYEQAGSWSERFDRMAFWDLSAENPLAQATGLPLRGDMKLVNSASRQDRHNLDLNKGMFAPRLGFAFRLTEKTALRGGYGIFWVPYDLSLQLGPSWDAINLANTPYVASLDGNITPYGSFSNPYPDGVTQPPERAANLSQIILNLGGGRNPVPNGKHNPYLQQWNFNIQRELPHRFFVDAAYAGSKGTHLGFSTNVNQLHPDYMAMGVALQQQVPNPFYGLIQGGTLAAPTVARGQLLRPYPQYTNVTAAGTGYGNSSYNSFQLKVQRMFSAGGTFLAAYTVAKFITNADTQYSWLEGSTGGVGGVQNWYCLQCSRSLSSHDVPQRLVISYVQELPFGRGRAFFSGATGFIEKLVSGWGVNGVTTFQSGFPLKLGTSVNLTNSFGGGSVPNVVAGCDAKLSGSAQERLNRWFNTACFTQPPAFTFGNAARVQPTLRMHGINNFDAAVFKNTRFGSGESLSLQFRAEFFNLFNHVQFGPPGTTLGNAQFGIVSSQVNNPRLIQFGLKLSF
jgi:hypothetical protein